ncbi:MAG TPA: GNAT family N-acetyltransferase, partial [Rhodocyclaceae bacterium]
MASNPSSDRLAAGKNPAHRVDPLDPTRMTSLKHWGEPPEQPGSDMDQRATVECGWGRVIFGHTFASPAEIAEELRDEAPERRDIALYVRDPHVVVAMAPQHLFIDPSHTYRLDLGTLEWCTTGHELWRVRPVAGQDDTAIDRIYRSRRMVPATGFYSDRSRFGKGVEVLVAEDHASGAILGAVTGIDHVRAFGDVDLGSSLWSLAVDPQCPHPGVGEGLVRALASGFAARGRAFMDLSVMYDKTDAIGLYEKLGFVRVPVYCVKNKNPINEWLFIGPDPAGELNVYARILIEEARRRGTM